MKSANRPDDVFRAELHVVIGRLRAWMEAMRDVASFDEHEDVSHWRLTVRPHESGAAPLEVIVHATQSIDLSIGPQTYEGEAVAELDHLVAIAEAIGRGEVVTREWRSAETNVRVRVDTLVMMPGSETWERRSDASGSANSERPGEATYRDRRWLPYRR